MTHEGLNVSVAMATYNGEKYIEHQMESLLEQTRKPDEVIISDDCSTDGTAGIIGGFIRRKELKNWNLTVNARNLGFIGNFYNAVQKTRGDIVFLCDQDDVWHSDKIEKMAAIIGADKRIKALNTAFCEIDGDGRPIPSKPKFKRSNHNLIKKRIRPGELLEIGFDYILLRNISPGCTMAFTKDVRDFFNRNRSGLCPHDWELNIFGAILGGLYFCNEPFTDYRLHRGNALGLIKLGFAERFARNINEAEGIKAAREERDRANVYSLSAWRDGLSPGQRLKIERYRRFTGKRLKMLEEKKLTVWFSLLVHARYYLRIKGPQGMLDDLKIILRREKARIKHK